MNNDDEREAGMGDYIIAGVMGGISVGLTIYVFFG